MLQVGGKDYWVTSLNSRKCQCPSLASQSQLMLNLGEKGSVTAPEGALLPRGEWLFCSYMTFKCLCVAFFLCEGKEAA